MNSLPVPIALHYTMSTAMISVPPLRNGPPEMVTLLYPVPILLVFNYLSILLYILSLMGMLLQFLFTSAITIIAIPSFITVFF